MLRLCWFSLNSKIISDKLSHYRHKFTPKHRAYLLSNLTQTAPIGQSKQIFSIATYPKLNQI